MNPATVDELITQGAVNLWSVISGIAAMLALILSVVNFIYLFRIRRVNYSIKLVDFDVGTVNGIDSQKQQLKTTFEIVNNSQLPVSITDIRLCADDQMFSEAKLPFVFNRVVYTINQTEYPQFFYNDHVPINLEALGSIQCNLVFLLPSGTIKRNEKTLRFQIRTNRNTEHEIELQAGEQASRKRNIL